MINVLTTIESSLMSVVAMTSRADPVGKWGPLLIFWTFIFFDLSLPTNKILASPPPPNKILAYTKKNWYPSQIKNKNKPWIRPLPVEHVYSARECWFFFYWLNKKEKDTDISKNNFISNELSNLHDDLFDLSWPLLTLYLTCTCCSVSSVSTLPFWLTVKM